MKHSFLFNFGDKLVAKTARERKANIFKQNRICDISFIPNVVCCIVNYQRKKERKKSPLNVVQIVGVLVEH